MKRLVTSCLLALAMCSFGLVAASPAGADTSCYIDTIGGPLPGSSTHIRKCLSDVVVGGAHFKGAVWWYFDGDAPHPPPLGQIMGSIYDIATDGYCAQVWFRHFATNGVRDYNRRVAQDCDGGNGTNMPDTGGQYFQYSGNGSSFRSGTWKVFITCHDASGRIFQEDVNATP